MAEWSDLLIPLAVALTQRNAKGGAFLEGYNRSSLLREEQDRRRAQDAQQQVYQQAQLANMTADNTRQEHRLQLEQTNAARAALDRLTGYIGDRGAQIAETATDPLQAQNQLAVDAFQRSQLLGVDAAGASGTLPNMSTMISARKVKRARELYEQGEKRLNPKDAAGNAVNPDWDRVVRLQDNPEFGSVTFRELRDLYEAPMVNVATGQPAMAAPSRPLETFGDVFTIARGSSLASKPLPMRNGVPDYAEASLTLQRMGLTPSDGDNDRARTRTVQAVRDEVYAAVLRGENVAMGPLVRRMQQAGLNPEVEIAEARRRLLTVGQGLIPPMDRQYGAADVFDPEALMNRGRSALTGGPVSTPPNAPLTPEAAAVLDRLRGEFPERAPRPATGPLQPGARYRWTPQGLMPVQ